MGFATYIAPFTFLPPRPPPPPPKKKSSTSIAHFYNIVESRVWSLKLSWNRVLLPIFLVCCNQEAPWSMATVIGKPQDKKKTKLEPHNPIAKDVAHSGRQATLTLQDGDTELIARLGEDDMNQQIETSFELSLQTKATQLLLCLFARQHFMDFLGLA